MDRGLLTSGAGRYVHYVVDVDVDVDEKGRRQLPASAPNLIARTRTTALPRGRMSSRCLHPRGPAPGIARTSAGFAASALQHGRLPFAASLTFARPSVDFCRFGRTPLTASSSTLRLTSRRVHVNDSDRQYWRHVYTME